MCKLPEKTMHFTRTCPRRACYNCLQLC